MYIWQNPDLHNVWSINMACEQFYTQSLYLQVNMLMEHFWAILKRSLRSVSEASCLKERERDSVLLDLNLVHLQGCCVLIGSWKQESVSLPQSHWVESVELAANWFVWQCQLVVYGSGGIRIRASLCVRESLSLSFFWVISETLGFSAYLWICKVCGRLLVNCGWLTTP